jgi:hypothetical protein
MTGREVLNGEQIANVGKSEDGILQKFQHLETIMGKEETWISASACWVEEMGCPGIRLAGTKPADSRSITSLFAGAWGQGGTVGRRALNGICATAPDAHATAPPGPPAGLHRPEKTHPTYFFRVQGQYHSPNSCSICRLRQDDAGTPPGFSVDVPTSPRTCTATATCVVVLWRVLLPSIVTPTGHARLAGGV